MRVTKADAERAEGGFLSAIKEANVWAGDPLWHALSNEATAIKKAWWDTVPKCQLVQCATDDSNVWKKGDIRLARKCGLPGWYLIDSYTTDGRNFTFSATESN